MISGSMTAGPLLLIDSFNARSFGLAQSDVAMHGDLDSILVNPAGLASLKGISASFFYLPWFEDMNIYSFAGGYPMLTGNKFYGTIALSLSTFSVKPFDNYDADGNKLPDLDASDLLLNLGYGYPLLNSLDIGMNLKYFYTKLGKDYSDPNSPDSTSSAIAFDIGAIAYFTTKAINISKAKIDNNLSAGFSIQNLGLSQKYIEEKSPLDYKIRSGISHLFLKSDKVDSKLMLELNKTRNHNIKFSAGIEAAFINLLMGRIGYKFGRTAIGFTAGAGICYNISGYNLAFDYSVVPLVFMDEVDVRHALSLKVEFGDMSKKLEINEHLQEIEIFYQERRYTSAIKKINTVLSLEPSNKEALEYKKKISGKYLKLAEKKKKESKFKDALKYWKKYQELNPDDQTAVSEISVLQDIINDNEEPEISLDNFQETDSITVNEQKFTLSGQITDNVALKTVKINNKEILLMEKNKAQINQAVELQEGENSIEIYTEDLNGNINEKTLKVIYEIKPLEETLEPIEEAEIEVPVEEPKAEEETEIPVEEEIEEIELIEEE